MKPSPALALFANGRKTDISEAAPTATEHWKPIVPLMEAAPFRLTFFHALKIGLPLFR
ncbi:hypothetical protein [Cohnella faecalis]|uniref:hypothetical protein n=1 Tax=Cohnella faecalis TaxID=2315694 RepID=UPI00131415B4|nr:hypothetical protein [Cohnella faecalis]